MIRNPDFQKLVVKNNLLTDEDVRRLSAKYAGDDFALLLHLLRGSVASKDFLGKLWGDSLNFAYVDLTKSMFQALAVQQLTMEYAIKNKVIPIYQFGDYVTIATANPTQEALVRDLESVLLKSVSLVFSFPQDIEDAIMVQYQSSTALGGLLDKISSHSLFKGTSKIRSEQIQALAGDQYIIQFAQGLVLLAVKERASDIHIEPAEDMVRIRFRIDGVLHERMKLDNALLPPLLTRYKVLAGLDITERRRPQDGRITIKLTNSAIDIRLSTVLIMYGEKIVMRILGQNEMREAPDVYDIGMSKRNIAMLIRLTEHPNGVFFVTGPTGSGKTTTLYAAIKHLNTPGINIMTVEDPVEIRLAGVNQVQVNPEIDLNFAAVLRSFLRQDPDVILVGEIRDAETARIAAQAALTGHLVLTTMHTNNSLQAVTRLIDIGIEPFLLAPSIIGTMAQRLVRKLCDNCKEKYVLSPEEMDRLFIYEGQPEVCCYQAKGCEQCSNTGFIGRVAIHEIFTITEEIRHLISTNATSIAIMDAAIKSGFKPMRYDGIKKVLRGLTTIGEIDRVTLVEAE
ncbi:MAG: type II/IV secretion system protein [Deltaproteobacteria bacterium HGW-Deltaproteobacteria-10]|nr:MAG: type II/IV secretion system protein [Deltaproteobacteria bacterium HGW-Deltaproteobacteria-10]